MASCGTFQMGHSKVTRQIMPLGWIVRQQRNNKEISENSKALATKSTVKEVAEYGKCTNTHYFFFREFG